MADSRPLEPTAAPILERAAAPADRAALRLPYLDSLRALAALYVVAFHCVLGFAAKDLNGPWRLLRRACAFGHEAVAIFIVLSGYCLMLPVIRRSPERPQAPFAPFIRRRALRILPPYFVALVLSLALLWLVPLLKVHDSGTIWDDSHPGLAFGPVLSHALLVHNWFPALAHQINGPLWSVATEWQIYFFFPLVLLPVWQKAGMFGALAVALLLSYAPVFFAPGPADTAGPWYLALFTLGMMAAGVGFAGRGGVERPPSGAWGLVAAGTWLVCLVLGNGAAELWFAHKPVTDLLVGVATAALLVHLTGRALDASASRGPILRLLGAGPLVSVGHFSYSLYLTHLPIVAFLYFVIAPLGLPPGPSALLLLVAGVLVAVPLAYAFHLAFERPFLLRR